MSVGSKRALVHARSLDLEATDEGLDRHQSVSAAHGVAGRQPVLLIADDEALVRGVIERLARKIGYDVVACATGTEAIHVAADRRPDVALVDLRMPGADGLSVLRAVRSDVPETSVIIMTAYAAIDSAVEAMKLGAREYMPKPLDFDALRTMLSELCFEIATRTPPTAADRPVPPEPASGRQVAPPSAKTERPVHLFLVPRSERAAKASTTSSLRVVSDSKVSPTAAGAGNDAGGRTTRSVFRGRRPGSRGRTRS